MRHKNLLQRQPLDVRRQRSGVMQPLQVLLRAVVAHDEDMLAPVGLVVEGAGQREARLWFGEGRDHPPHPRLQVLQRALDHQPPLA